MKKIVVTLLILTFCMGVLSGCQKESPEDPTIVYSFQGGDENLRIINGVIVFSPEEDIIYGGELEHNLADTEELRGFSMKFYVLSGGEKETLLTSAVQDATEGGRGSALLANVRKLPCSWGKGTITNTREELENNLYFELVIDREGKESEVHQIKLEVTEVTRSAAETEG